MTPEQLRTVCAGSFAALSVCGIAVVVALALGSLFGAFTGSEWNRVFVMGVMAAVLGQICGSAVWDEPPTKGDA